MIIKRRYHLHPPGVVYCVITILLGLGALNSQNNLLFGAFGLALGGLLISGIVSGAMLMGLRVRRLGIEPAPVGERIIIRYEVTNRTRFYPVFAVRIGERRVSGSTFNRHIIAHDTLVMHLAPRQSMRLAASCPADRRASSRSMRSGSRRASPSGSSASPSSSPSMRWGWFIRGESRRAV